MDGKLNCSMTAENAAFTKIRHLDSRVTDAETRLDILEQETTQLDGALQNALTSLGEKVETESVDTTSLKADTVEAVNVTSDNVNTLDLTATTIEAETINADNLENVNVLHGKTVDVEKTIATIGQFTETQTTTANNSTTNTTELNVSNEANLTGQVNIDGDVTFIKDNGLSKLQGNYLEIDAANVVIDNKNDAEYALYVPGINGDALFGGSVAVQDTLATKNLMVTEEAHFSNLTLNENTVLDNPTLENIAQTQELTDKALDIDENGKIVRKFVAGGSAGSVASALIANETRYNYGGLLDKYKQVEEEGAPFQIILSDTASYTFYPDLNDNSYLENSNGQRYVFEVEPQVSSMLQMLSLVHKNIFYTVVPTLDDVKDVIGATLLKINMNNMNVEYSIDVSEYFICSLHNLSEKLAWIPSQCGNILSDDKPVLPFTYTNKYVDLVSGNILTRDTKFLPGSAYYLSKTNNWYQLVGSSAANEYYWATNNKYSSIEDAALVDTPYQDDNAYIVDAPVFMHKGRRIQWFDRGISNALTLDSKTVLVLDENDNKVLFSPGLLRFNGVEYATNLYNNLGYVVNEYIAEIPYYVEKVKIDRTQADFTDVPITADTITINDKATIKDIETSTIETSTIDAEVVKTIDAEVDGMTFYRGKWYDKVFSSAKPLVDYILDTTDKSPYQTYNILFTGNVLDFRAADLPNTTITSSQVIGTYKVYSDSNDDVRELNFVEDGYDPLAIGFHLFNSIYFYGFETQLDVASKDNTRCLHLNNCTLHFKDNYGASTSVGIVKLNKCNNVSITATNINWNSFPGAEWENCNNVQLRNWGFINGGTYSSMSIWMVDCNDCYIAVPPINIKTVSFGQVGKGNNLVVHFKSEYGTKKEPTYTTAIQ